MRKIVCNKHTFIIIDVQEVAAKPRSNLIDTCIQYCKSCRSACFNWYPLYSIELRIFYIPLYTYAMISRYTGKRECVEDRQ